MLVRKNLSIVSLWHFAGFHLIWLFCWMSLVVVLYKMAGWYWLHIPWLPVSLVGTAVAFYVGFKNSQSYDRLWESRKIWGGIVNSSRSWAAMVNALVPPGDNPSPRKTKLIYRHIAWLYTLRKQLLVPAQWEHVSLWWKFGSINVHRRKKYGIGAFPNVLSETQKKKYFEEEARWNDHANPAAQIIRVQAEEIAQFNKEGFIDSYKQVELQRLLNDLYDQQGMAERIKRFPFPRQYGYMGFIFVCIFILLLPFGIVGEFAKLGAYGAWLAIPIGTIVGWIYVVMELIGDYSENPFEGLPYDVPMLSICRSIEIDMLQMSGDKDIPAPIQPVNDILM